MQKFLSLMLLVFCTSTHAAIKDLECVGDLTKDSFSRRTHLTLNPETNALEGYRGSIETGGIFFSAVDIFDKTHLEISRDLGNRLEVIAAKDFDQSENDQLIEVQLEEDFVASLFCFKM